MITRVSIGFSLREGEACGPFAWMMRARENTLSMLRELPQIDRVVGFSGAGEALAWLEENETDLAVLDIAEPGTDGLALAAEIKRTWPETAVLFTTLHPEYALKAFELHADGYMVKPLSKELLAGEVAIALAKESPPDKSRVCVKTFGDFTVIADGQPVHFRQARCRELLAYLVDRRGSSVTRAEAFAILWEDRRYDRSMQKQLDGVIHSMHATLQGYGIGRIFETESGVMRIRPEQIECDLYRFCAGDEDAVKEYRGEYMNGYSWAELTEGVITRKAAWRTAEL